MGGYLGSALSSQREGGKGNCGKVKETIDVQRGNKTQKQGESTVDIMEILSRPVYHNKTEIFPASAEL